MTGPRHCCDSPLDIHLPQLVQVPVDDGLLQGLAHPQPARQDQARLGPRKHPGDGAQRRDTCIAFHGDNSVRLRMLVWWFHSVPHHATCNVGAAAGGARADVEVAKLGLWRGVLEVLDEVRMLNHHAPVGLNRDPAGHT